MREIKFRAWHKVNKVMCDVYRIYFSTNGVATMAYNKSFGEDGGNIDDYELMQYTGLKDCKGNEIYEGDIVKFFNLSNTFEVIYRKGCWGYNVPFDYISLGMNYHFQWKDGKSDRIEIISNRWENPELLEGQ